MTETPVPHHVIVRLRAVGGFLSGLNLELADGLNCFIGGRGAGKTTALEFIRFGLGVMPDQRANPQRYRALEALMKANLGSGRVQVDLRTKDGLHYRAERGDGEGVAVTNEQGTAVPVFLDRDQIFSADVFSQNEIEEMAASPVAQLTLLDRFKESQSAAISQESEVVLRDIKQANERLRRLDEEIADLLGKSSEIGALAERLKGLAAPPGPDAARLNDAHEKKSVRAKEDRIPTAARAALDRLERGLEQTEATFRTSADALFADSAGPTANAVAIERIRGGMTSVLNAVEASVAMSIAEIRRAGQTIGVAEADLAAAHVQQDADYRALVEQTAEESGRVAERLNLQAALAAAEEADRDRSAKARLREEILLARQTRLQRLSELRDSRFLLRKNVAARLTADLPFLRVTVEQSAGLDRYKEALTSLLRGVGLKQGPAADKLIERFLPSELAEAVTKRDLDRIMRETGFDRERAIKVADALMHEGAHYEIQCIDLDDVPSIELKDGDQYKVSSRLSTGQRCTTILPILLLQNARPLLIDQPEDNLDNAFIYESVVTALRAVKTSRQVIFVTHNPNIPVLGEADRVFVFASDGEHAGVVQAGSVDDCKDHIERVLEGGREAFMKRRARYGH